MIAGFAFAGTAFAGYKIYDNMHAHIAPGIEKLDSNTDQHSGGGAAQPTAPAAGQSSESSQPIQPQHPYDGLKIILKGVFEGKGKKTAYFDLQPLAGGKVFQLTDKDFIEAGYQVKLLSNCLALMTFNGVGFTASCGNSSEDQPLAPTIQPPVSQTAQLEPP